MCLQFTDLAEIKTMLDIDLADKTQDRKLLLLMTQATNIIEETVGRKDMTFQSRTEYYNGSGTQQLCLNMRPVFISPEPRCWIDGAGFYGQTSGAFASNTEQIFGQDFFVKVDEAATYSRAGILIRRANVWPRPSYRQGGWLSPFVGHAFGNIKVTYSAGWTLDTLPGEFRIAANLLMGKLYNTFPLGMELNSESYEERSLSYVNSEKVKLIGLVRPLLFQYRNWKW